MKILVRSLREGTPEEVHSQYNPKELDLEFPDLAYLEGLTMEGTVERLGSTLTFRGHLTSRVEHTCARCLKPVTEAIDRPFEMTYDIRGEDELDTSDDLREVLLLDHPIRFLCREDCPGLCSRCGADLSQEGACSCSSS